MGSVLSYFSSPSPLPLASPSPSPLPLSSPSPSPSPLPLASPSPSPSPLPFPPPPPSLEIKYDVFLNFRGVDTRNNFTSHLYKAFHEKGIHAFIDDQLRTGNEISPSLLKAIEVSQISVVIFSVHYADSVWCLEELLKIFECKKNHGQFVIPVFYEIDPADVRKQTGSYAAAFKKHEYRFKRSLDRVQRWRCALAEGGSLSGYCSCDIQPESLLIEKIVGDVLKMLNNMPSSDNNKLVGIKSKITEIEEMLWMGDHMNNDVRTVGICGIKGIGKTTLAKAVFERNFYIFEGFFFIGSIREASKNKELNCLKHELYSKISGGGNAYIYTSTNKRLSRKKLLIVFDDVTSFKQIEYLIGDVDCFHLGSRIIITSRNHEMLKNCGVNDIYKVEELCFNDSLQLFCQHAFKQNFPKVDYRELSKCVVKKVGGVPLAIKVVGSFLLGKKKKVWECSMKKLENILSKDIHEMLINYDGLEKSVEVDEPHSEESEEEDEPHSEESEEEDEPHLEEFNEKDEPYPKRMKHI